MTKYLVLLKYIFFTRGEEMDRICYTSKMDYIPSVIQSINKEADMQIDFVTYTENIRRLMVLANPTILLFDIEGIEKSEVQHTITYLKQELPEVSIIILTAPVHEDSALWLIEAGIDSVIEKKEHIHTHIVSTIRTAAEGHFIMPSKLISPLLSELQELKAANFDIFYRRLYEYDIELSKREAEVAYLMKQGLKNGTIAKKLQLSEGTIKVHVNHIYKKFPIKRRRNVIELLNKIMVEKNLQLPTY